MDYLKTVEKIVQSILIEIKDSINSKAEYDKTFVAKISGTINEETYSVLYCGKTYKVSSTIYCDTGDYVRVCAPCNNWSKLYVVENKTKRKTLQDQIASIQSNLNERIDTTNANLSTINDSVQVLINQLNQLNIAIAALDTKCQFKNGNIYGNSYYITNPSWADASIRGSLIGSVFCYYMNFNCNTVRELHAGDVIATLPFSVSHKYFYDWSKNYPFRANGNQLIAHGTIPANIYI